VFLSERFGQAVLFSDGQRTFCAATALEPSIRKPRARRIVLYRLQGTDAARLPMVYECPHDRLIYRVYSMPVGRRPGGYFPLFLLEEHRRKEKGQRRNRMDLVYLRLEQRDVKDSLQKQPQDEPLVNPKNVPDARRKNYRPMPLADHRPDPRTDPSKDRRLFRVGDRWVVVYADDNPGRLVAASLERNKLGEPITFLKRRAWGRYQCAASPDGADGLDVVCGDTGGVTFVRLTGLKDWGDSGPQRLRETVLASGLAHEPWPSICRGRDRALVAVYVDRDRLMTRRSVDNGTTWSDARAVKAPAHSPRPTLITYRGKPLLLVGDAKGLCWARWQDGAWSPLERIVEEDWVGPHFSAAASGDRLDLVYTPGESYLGRRAVFHTAVLPREMEEAAVAGW